MDWAAEIKYVMQEQYGQDTDLYSGEFTLHLGIG